MDEKRNEGTKDSQIEVGLRVDCSSGALLISKGYSRHWSTQMPAMHQERRLELTLSAQAHRSH